MVEGTIFLIITLVLLAVDCFKSERIKKDKEVSDKRKRLYAPLMDLSKTSSCVSTVKHWVFHKSILENMREEVEEILKYDGKIFDSDDEIIKYLQDADRINLLADVLASKSAMINDNIIVSGVRFFDYNRQFAKACYTIIKRNMLERGHDIKFCMVRDVTWYDTIRIEEFVHKGDLIVHRF